MSIIKTIFKNIYVHKNVFLFLFLYELVRQLAVLFVLDNSFLNFIFWLFLGVLSNVIFLFIPFLIIRIKEKTYLYLISIILSVSNLFYLVHLFHFKAPFSIGAIAVVAETTPRETFEFVDTVGLSIIIFSFLLSILPLIWLRFFNKISEKPSFKTKAWICVIIPLYFILNIIDKTFVDSTYNRNLINPFTHSYVYQDFKQIAYYYREQKRLKSYVENRPDYKFSAEYVGDNQDFNFVIILGESMSKYHMQLYGYHRKTTPNLSSDTNLFVFNDVISPATQTRESIIRMLSLAKGKYEEQFYKKGSIITAAKEGGYYVTWLSNQMILGISDTETSVIAMDADETEFINTDWNSSSLDENLLPLLNKALLEGKSKKKMIILHLLGNHFKYEHRYKNDNKKEFSEYEYPDYIKENHKEIIDHYDNSIIYSDSILNQIIEMTYNAGKPSVVLYLSDHGEEVYDNEGLHLGHGSPVIRKEVVDIPFFLWVSPLINNNRRDGDYNDYLDRKYSSQDLFHTIADLANLSFADFDNTKSIVSKDFKEIDRKVLNANNKLINYKDIK